MKKVHFYSDELGGIVCQCWVLDNIKHTTNPANVTCKNCLKALAGHAKSLTRSTPAEYDKEQL